MVEIIGLEPREPITPITIKSKDGMQEASEFEATFEFES